MKPLDYRSHVLQNNVPYKNRVLVAIPMTGSVRAEWMMARYGQIIPTNWSQLEYMHFMDTFGPVGYVVADARNTCVKMAVEKDMEWLLFIDHDTIIPADAFIRLNDYMRNKKYPVVSGLYFTRSDPAEPLIYRGRGNSYFDDWDMGDKVWVDGIPMGCTLIHCSILREMYKNSEEYMVGNQIMRKVFETPTSIWFDPVKQEYNSFTGTEDLQWCDRVMKEDWFTKAGWGKHFKKHPKNPFLMDTGIFCRHISPEGTQYPLRWQELMTLKLERERLKKVKEIV